MSRWFKTPRNCGGTAINLDAVSQLYVLDNGDACSVWARDGSYSMRVCNARSRSEAFRMIDRLIRLPAEDHVYTVGSIMKEWRK